MRRQVAYARGLLAGFRYTLDDPGDCLPEHAHDAAHAHNIIVLTGAVQLVVDGESAGCFIPGAIADFDGTRPHLIRALEPNTTILNLYTNGAPDDFDPEYDGHF